MVVKTTTGSLVSFTDTNKKSLFEDNGTEWARDPSMDDADRKLIGFTETKNHICSVQLTIPEMRRVCDGVHAMNTPTTVEEMRWYTLKLHKSLILVIDQWSNQRLREILIEAEEGHKHPGLLLERYAQAQVERDRPQEMPTEATGRPTEAHEAPRTARSTPRPRKQEGSVSVAFGEASVLLTPKQLEFMERLNECPGWNEHGVEGEYIASEYAAELTDSMNAMSMGAVLTTLREKHLLQTEKRRMGAIKCCIFKLTDTGIKVYNKLAGKEEI